jgi:hypothetical protein
MEQPTTKAAVVVWLHRERTYWHALLSLVSALVSEDDMLLPGVVGEWTFKDVVAHLTVWRKRTVARFVAAQEGGEVPPPEWPAGLDDALAVNDWTYRLYRDRTLTEILVESELVWQQLIDAVAVLPEATLFERARYEWSGGRPIGPANLAWSFGHLHEHAAHINDWLARRLEE